MPIENKSPDPTSHFTFDMAEYLHLWDDITGIVHSHTSGPDKDERGNLTLPSLSPSKLDMESQIATNLPWGISTVRDDTVSNPIWWGDMLEVRPLIGRVFVHGINDCFSLIRDWHRLNGIFFEDVPRDAGWWKEPKEDGTYPDLYMDLFESRGFSVVEGRGPQEGDVVIGHLHSPHVRNHGGVFVSSDTFLHHAADSLSRRALSSVWRQKVSFLVRHKDLPQV